MGVSFLFVSKKIGHFSSGWLSSRIPFIPLTVFGTAQALKIVHHSTCKWKRAYFKIALRETVKNHTALNTFVFMSFDVFENSIQVEGNPVSRSVLCSFSCGLSSVGNHGYDNTLRSMQPIFVARGPAFRQNYVKPAMRSVDLYPLMCHILAIPPLPNNGSFSNVRDLLHPEPTASPTSVPTPAGLVRPSYFPVVVGSLLGLMLVVGFLMVFVQQVTLKQLPSLKHASREMSQPLLQEDLHL